MKTKTLWKALSFAFVMVLIFGLVGCSNKEEPKSAATQASMGEYSTAGAEAGDLMKEAKEALEAALTGTEFESYRALTCYGTQVVAGMNYQFIGVFDHNLYTAKVYHPLSGQDELTACEAFDLVGCLLEDADFSKNEAGEPLAGGWTVPEESGLSTMPSDLASAFGVLFKDGYALRVLAALGSKSADGGTDYVLLCQDVSTENGGLYVAELNAKELGGGGTLLAVHPFVA